MRAMLPLSRKFFSRVSVSVRMSVKKKREPNGRFRSHSHSLFCSQDRRSVELFIIITLIIGGKLDLSGKNMEFRIRVRVNVEVSVKKNDRVCGRIRSHIHSVICSGGES